jgi:ribulose-phosphate 3-epimerase
MGVGRARLAASIVAADFGNLYRVVRKLEKAGADRLHLDIVDGHFAPLLSFGPAVVRSLRRLTRLPLDVHLGVTEPGRFVDEVIAAGSDSITFPVEAPMPDDDRIALLRLIRRHGRGAGLAVSPSTSVRDLEPYRQEIDISLVLTADAGPPGQPFRRETSPKIAAAVELFRERPHGWEVHVEGGISRDTADVVGGQGADILIVGSALFHRGHDIAREIRLVKALADEGWTRDIGHGEPPIPRDEWTIVATLPLANATALSRSIESVGIPTLVLRTGPFVAGVEAARAVMVPATAEVPVRTRFGLGFVEEDEL